jgi:signal transduction histidine kinase
MRRVRADFDEAARQYEPLAVLPGEAYVWGELKADIAALDQSTERVLALSRKNLDVQARAAMVQVDARFEVIHREMDALIDINHAAATRTIGEIRDAQRSELMFLLMCSAAGVALASVVAFRVVRTVRAREDQVRRVTTSIARRNEDLDAFASRVAHDLRGPLNTMSFAVARLSQRAPDDGTNAILRRGVARMESLIEDLLTLSRIDAVAQGSVCDPAKVAASVLEDIAPQLKDVGGQIHVDVEPATLLCSEGFLRQTLWNLTDNAVKYRRTEVAPDIHIAGRPVGTTYELRIIDNGIGMSAEETSHAFEPFFRASRAPNVRGTGLGLSIVKRVVEASGGSVSVDSQLGCGTTFTVRVPLQPEAHPGRRPSEPQVAAVEAETRH